MCWNLNLNPQRPQEPNIDRFSQNVDPNLPAISKISLLDNQPAANVTEPEFFKTAASGHRPIRYLLLSEVLKVSKL